MSAFYSDELIEKIKDSNDIVDVISEYVKLKKSGRNYFGLCPFHTEKTPSFSVSPDKQIFYCFGCGTGGNAIHFIAKIENLEFIEAVKHLAERARIQLPEGNQSDFKPEKLKLKEQILLVNIEAGRYFYNNLPAPEAGAAREYLKKRGITPETVKKFGIGISYGVNSELSNFLSGKGFSQEVIIASGLAFKDKRDRLQDKFRARIMFPILDVRERIIGFGGRVLDNSLPKYMNSPETMVFNKRKNLYGLNLARKSKEKTVIVVEGYMDAISLYQHGMDNVVASLGTSFTQEQGRLLRKYFDEIVIAFDSDSAGQSAALRSLDLLNSMEIPVRVLNLVDAKDPDEFIRKKGITQFKELASQAKSLPEFKIGILKKEFDLKDTKGKIGFVNKTALLLSKVQNNIEKDAYIRQVAQETGIGVESIYAEINRILFKENKTLRIPKNVQLEAKKNVRENIEISLKSLQAEKMLIRLLSTNDEKLYKFISQNINIKDFNVQINRHIVEKIYRLYKEKKDAGYSDILNILETEEEVNAYTQIIQQENEFEDSYKIAKDLLDTIEREKREYRRKQILMEMTNTKLSQADITILEEELKKLTKLQAN